ncbi:hypothetical protein CerSpe_205760 [Prunus speciosa]
MQRPTHLREKKKILEQEKIYLGHKYESEIKRLDQVQERCKIAEKQVTRATDIADIKHELMKRMLLKRKRVRCRSSYWQWKDWPKLRGLRGILEVCQGKKETWMMS